MTMVADSRRFIENRHLGDVLNAVVSAALKAGFAVAFPGGGCTGITLNRPCGSAIHVRFFEGSDQPLDIAEVPFDGERPFEPSEADWAAYNQMFDEDDGFPKALPDSGFPVRNRLSPEALANIRRIAWDA